MFYKLDENKNAIKCTPEEWSHQFYEMCKSGTKHVASEDIGDYWVSTVWIGIDHSYHGAEPLLFETMIKRNGEWEEYQERYSTYNEALEGHKLAIEWVKSEIIINEEKNNVKK